MKIQVPVFLTILTTLCASSTGTTDSLPIDDVLSNFLIRSIEKLNGEANVEAEFSDTLNLGRRALVADIDGILSEIKATGLSSLKEITSPACELNYGWCNVELVLEDFSLSGVYHLNGSVASAVQLGTHGNWSVSWPGSVKATFNGGFSIREGIAEWSEQYSNFQVVHSDWYQTSIKTTFHGLVNNGSLDKGLEQEILTMLGNYIRLELSFSTADALTKTFVQHIQRDFNQTSLLDILKVNTSAVSRMIGIQKSRESHSRGIMGMASSVPNDRFKAFALKSLLELKEVVNSTLDIIGSYRLNMDRGEFLTADGILTDMKFVGLKEMVDVNVGEYTSIAGGRLACSFRMPNISISGKYNLTGKLAASVPLAAVGDFSITAGEATLELDGNFNNVNGYFKWDRVFFHGFQYSEDVLTSFPEFIPTEELGSNVKEAMLHFLGGYIMNGMSQGTLLDQLEDTVIQHLDSAFVQILLIDIVSGSAGSH